MFYTIIIEQTLAFGLRLLYLCRQQYNNTFINQKRVRNVMKAIDLSERFSEHFVLSEFLRSATAEAYQIPNIPLKCHIERLRNLTVRCLEPTRQRFNLPLRVTSGYRCPLLNKLVGGVPNSQHMEGFAADIQVPRQHWPFSITSEQQMARVLFAWMRDSLPDYDQLIIEHHGQTWWVHVSCHIDLTKNRREALEIEKLRK